MYSVFSKKKNTKIFCSHRISVIVISKRKYKKRYSFSGLLEYFQIFPDMFQIFPDNFQAGGRLPPCPPSPTLMVKISSNFVWI